MIKDIIINNIIVKFIYKCKFYLDLGINQISWFTGKLPEIASVIIIFNWLGIDLPKEYMPIVMGIGIIVLIGLGYFWKNSGMWDTEMIIVNEKHPVWGVVYKASKKVLEDDKRHI